MVQRTQMSQQLTLTVRLYGEKSPQLATAVAAAKKAEIPKATIEGAIARGTGRSASGAALESMTLEFLMPSSVAVIVDIETDNRLRTLHEVRDTIRKHKGSFGSTKFFFSRVGRVVFERSEAGVGPDDIMDDVIEAGAEDLDADDEGNMVVWTQPSHTFQVAKGVGTKFGLQTLSSDIIWQPNEETMTGVGSGDDANRLADLLAALRTYPEVQAIYANASRGDRTEEEWARVEENLDS